MQVVWDEEQRSQAEGGVKPYVAMDFASCKRFFCLEDGMMVRKLEWDTLSLMKPRGLVFRRGGIVLRPYPVAVM